MLHSKPSLEATISANFSSEWRHFEPVDIGIKSINTD